MDGPWDNAKVSIWTMVEYSLVIFCSCTITYRPLFNRLCGNRAQTSPSANRSHNVQSIGGGDPQAHAGRRRKNSVAKWLGKDASLLNSVGAEDVQTETTRDDSRLDSIDPAPCKKIPLDSILVEVRSVDNSDDLEVGS